MIDTSAVWHVKVTNWFDLMRELDSLLKRFPRRKKRNGVSHKLFRYALAEICMDEMEQSHAVKVMRSRWGKAPWGPDKRVTGFNYQWKRWELLNFDAMTEDAPRARVEAFAWLMWYGFFSDERENLMNDIRNAYMGKSVEEASDVFKDYVTAALAIYHPEFPVFVRNGHTDGRLMVQAVTHKVDVELISAMVG